MPSIVLDSIKCLWVNSINPFTISIIIIAGHHQGEKKIRHSRKLLLALIWPWPLINAPGIRN